MWSSLFGKGSCPGLLPFLKDYSVLTDSSIPRSLLFLPNFRPSNMMPLSEYEDDKIIKAEGELFFPTLKMHLPWSFQLLLRPPQRQLRTRINGWCRVQSMTLEASEAKRIRYLCNTEMRHTQVRKSPYGQGFYLTRLLCTLTVLDT